MVDPAFPDRTAPHERHVPRFGPLFRTELPHMSLMYPNLVRFSGQNRPT